ncbi:aggregation-promoting factor C-terminal-like domain-containing protein [Nocardiopsis halotolerans]|uniref:aggregation-promoting factor C-terminal-like domain-containing protein n=1 Tax=Nocardiopsis halotolerans TaxID=124252 RepID=UPI00034AD55C|nr:hypothetical protein [Nocardiopsis halotolerans]
MPTPHHPALGDTRRPSPTGPPGRPDERNGPPRFRHRVGGALRRLVPAARAASDRGAAFVELAAVTVLAAAIMVAVYQLELSQAFNDGVRQMVCLVQGPDCDDETWVEADRPEEPETYDWGGGNSTALENEALALDMAADHGWTENEWQCLSNLWNVVSQWDHTFINSQTGDNGISGFNPARHGAMPEGFRGSPSVQISWGLDYIDETYGAPCAAWAQWESTGTY